MLAYAHFIFAGFIPCRVLGRSEDGTKLYVRFTATRGAWKRGEVKECGRGDICTRPLRVSRQSRGALYSYTLSDEAVAGLPVIPPPSVQLDKRFLIRREYTGAKAPQWVARLEGAWIGAATSKREAENLARHWLASRINA